ncbi:isopentenyl-diphosphate delta-isomerase [Serratia fonticola]|uniref:Isopentenyl-diphosphate Delta-isomerase n=1 Tax=Serratia fonticola TaxID=47917 RepID=A0A542D8E0_SERFO|nr:isopentenyl-diphosphate Delta-isomerase [Serratia fonticola]TQI78625.1 isopentenyl-diphosphate delta-isomerase [Serratia fonticola]TQI99353.1 isopentenyl-diphosphate delta-isomerase [Serratia fonticola]TVZ68878.1 isopentenyl-diphosphate delta-isomerase [Serratia fonticola]
MLQHQHVVLLDEQGQPTGIMDKYAAHQQQTPLHLAFSTWIFNPQSQLLVTRRALSKKAWPGVWTNSVCGHPQWQEPFEHAIQQRCRYEVGLEVEHITAVAPDFRYCETDASGIMENEICPVYAALAVGDVMPRVNEVMDFHWVDLSALMSSLATTPWAFSPWMVQQLSRPQTVENLIAFTKQR